MKRESVLKLSTWTQHSELYFYNIHYTFSLKATLLFSHPSKTLYSTLLRSNDYESVNWFMYLKEKCKGCHNLIFIRLKLAINYNRKIIWIQIFKAAIWLKFWKLSEKHFNRFSNSTVILFWFFLIVDYFCLKN